MKAVFALSLVLVSHAAAAQTDFGGATKAFALLQEPVGARPAAMGLAFESVAQGSEGWAYNPAGPAFSEAWAVGINHDTWLADAGRETAGVLSPAGGWGAVAARGNVVLYPTVDLRDSLGQRTGTFRAQDSGFGLAWAKTIVKNFGIGMTRRYPRNNLPQNHYTNETLFR